MAYLDEYILGISLNAYGFSDINHANLGGLPTGVCLSGLSSLQVSAQVDYCSTIAFNIDVVFQVYSGATHGSGTLLYSLTKKFSAANTRGEDWSSADAIDTEIPISGFSAIPEGACYLKLSARAYKSGYTDATIFSSPKYFDFSLYSYSLPTLPSFSVNRCLVDGTNDEDGTYIEATVQFAASSIGGNNALTLEIYRKLVADSAYTLDKTIDISALGMSGTSGPTVLTLEYLTNAAYDVKAVLTDLISTVNNVKTVQTAFKLVDFDSVNKKVALGKAAEPTGPSFDVGVGMDAQFRDTVDFDKAPTIAAAEIAAFFAKHMPYIKLKAPTSEKISFNSSYYCWVPAFQTIQRNDNDAFEILLGGSGGTRKMGVVIPAAGHYRMRLAVALTGGSTTNGIIMLIGRFPSTWTPPTNNYLVKSTFEADATEFHQYNQIAWIANWTSGEIVWEAECLAGDKIWFSFFAANTGASKTIDSALTECSIQRIG